MVVPAYCRSRAGRVYRIQRLSQQLTPDRVRYVLRATPIKSRNGTLEGKEASREIDAGQLREQIANRQVVPTPEELFEQLWQQLRLDIDAYEEPPDAL